MDIDEINEILDKMDVLLSKDELEYEDEEMLQEYFHEVQRAWDEVESFMVGSEEDFRKQLKIAKRRFEEICSQFETPDDIREIGMDNMFPDGEGMEGFDWTFED